MTVSRSVDVNFDLLDRQIVDVDDRNLGRVDDLRLEMPEDGGRPRVTGLLVGPEALGSRFGSRLGRWIAGVGRLRRGSWEPLEIPLDLVDGIGNFVHLRVRWDHEALRSGSRSWFAAHLIERIPGSHRAS